MGLEIKLHDLIFVRDEESYGVLCGFNHGLVSRGLIGCKAQESPRDCI